jgi:hypothetical protein
LSTPFLAAIGSCRAFRDNAVRLHLGLQPSQLHAHAGPAQGGGTLVAHDTAREAGEESGPGSCAMAATWGSSSPRSQCRGCCSRASYVGSMSCAHGRRRSQHEDRIDGRRQTRR